LDEVYGLILVFFLGHRKRSRLLGQRDEQRYWVLDGFSMTSPIDWMRFTDLFGFFSFWASVKEAAVGGDG
jgi:hypothetical protein